MQGYWLNGALCLRPDTKEEGNALVVLHQALQAGLKPNPDDALPLLGPGESEDIDSSKHRPSRSIAQPSTT